MGAEAWLNAIWYGGARVPLALRALAGLFALLAALRRAAYRVGLRRRYRLPVPVVVIGNVTVGGTGKTPLTICLARALAARGWHVGVVLRGYGTAARAARLVGAHSSAEQVGDEALLIRARSACPVAVGRDRVAAARLLLAEGVQLILSDDGLQHLALQRDAEIGVIDAERGFGNGRLLPAGPLRERPARLAAVSAVVLTGSGALRWPGAFPMALAGERLESVSGQGAGMALAALAGQTVHAVAGIGNPQRFFAALRAAGLVLIEHPFADHHAYRPADLDFGDARAVLMTEKDAVKCASFAGPACWYLPIEAQFSAADLHALLGRICVDARLLDILACPLCKGPLKYDRDGKTLVCRADRLAFPVRDGVPIMLEEEARTLQPDDPALQSR